jgi:hypothetical protein
MSKVITARMIRDLLHFKGDMSIESLEEALGVPYLDFKLVLAKAVERKEVSEYTLFNASNEGLGDVWMYGSLWSGDES